LTEVVNYDIQC